MHLGIDQQSGLAYEGTEGPVLPVIPRPMVSQCKLIKQEEDWNDLPTGLASSPMFWILRGDTLSPKMKVFHCMRMFTVAMAKYIRRNCQGKGAAVRREYLLTEVLNSGAPMPPGGLAELRKQIKRGIEPSQEMLDKFSAKFLGPKPLGYDLV